MLYDDRPKVSPGVKFKDAELIGVPTIVVVGKGLADGTVEVKDRRSGEREEVAVADGGRAPGRRVRCVGAERRRAAGRPGPVGDPIEAVIFDWGGTLTPWHTVDFHAECAGPRPGGRARPTPDDHEQRLHARRRAWCGARSRDQQHERHGRRHLRRRPGSTHDEALLTAYREFWEPHTYTDPDVPPLFEALRAEGIKVGVLSNTVWPRAWHEDIFVRDGVLRPHRRRRLHQRDPVDQAGAAGVPRPRWTRWA